MKTPREGQLLRIFVGESDQWHGKPLYEAIVMKARELHLAGATVLRGPMGFGAHTRMHTAKILRLSEDLPVVIEIVDAAGHLYSTLAPSGRIEVEESGPIRAGIKTTGHHRSSEHGAFFAYVNRFVFYAGLPFVRVCTTWGNDR